MAIRPGTDTKSELEQYGVWVKAEPQDIVEEKSASGVVDMDSELSGEPPAVAEESFLSEDEEKLLGSFDSEFDSKASGPLPDLEDIPALEEPVLSESFGSASPKVDESLPVASDINFEESDNAGLSSDFRPGVEIEMSSVEGLDNPDTSKKQSSSSIEDVSSEFLDVSEEPSPRGATSPAEGSQFVSDMDDVTAEFLDIEESIAVPKAVAESSADFESLDIDLHFDDTVNPPGSPRGPSAEEGGFEAITEFDDFLGSDDSKADARADSGFDDVSAVERELSSPSPAPVLPVSAAASAAPLPQAQGSRPDLSTEILLKIADELASIRGELVTLRTKIGDVVVAGETASGKASESPAESQDESVSSGGFFDDEEDETIALTGDELDNILNTADFTTEEASESEQPLGMDDEELAGSIASAEDGDLLDETLLPESGDYSLTPGIEPAIEEVRLGEADSVDEVVEEESGLDLVAEEGVVPLTMAPDDTSYLESPDTLDLGEGSLPADRPLVEPDLSDFDLGVEDLEPRAEVDEELPLASSESSFDSEDITLGMEAGLDYAEEVPSEAEFLETIPEIDEPNFSEISLHEENPTATEAEEILPISDASPIPEISEDEEDLMLSAVEEPLPSVAEPRRSATPNAGDDGDRLKTEIKSVLSYLDKLLDSLPEEKIEEFAKSKYFDTYKKLFEELGLV